MTQDTYSNEYYERIATLLTQSLDTAKEYLETADYNDVRHYIEHSEYGVAYELLTHLLYSEGVSYPHDLKQAGSLMGFDPTSDSASGGHGPD